MLNMENICDLQDFLSSYLLANKKMMDYFFILSIWNAVLCADIAITFFVLEPLTQLHFSRAYAQETWTWANTELLFKCSRVNSKKVFSFVLVSCSKWLKQL